MSKYLALAVSTIALAGCAKAVVPVEAPKEPERYRPAWTLNVNQHLDAMRACLEARESPRHVLFVDSLISGGTGVSTVDAFEQVEHCAFQDGRLVRREPVGPIREFAGLPLFSLGFERPQVGAEAVVEEVRVGDHVVGWLWWPSVSTGTASSESAGGDKS